MPGGWGRAGCRRASVAELFEFPFDGSREAEGKVLHRLSAVELGLHDVSRGDYVVRKQDLETASPGAEAFHRVRLAVQRDRFPEVFR